MRYRSIITPSQTVIGKEAPLKKQHPPPEEKMDINTRTGVWSLQMTSLARISGNKGFNEREWLKLINDKIVDSTVIYKRIYLPIEELHDHCWFLLLKTWYNCHIILIDNDKTLLCFDYYKITSISTYAWVCKILK